MKAIVFLFLFNLNGADFIVEENATINNTIPIHSLEECQREAKKLMSIYSNDIDFPSGETLVRVDCLELQSPYTREEKRVFIEQ